MFLIKEDPLRVNNTRIIYLLVLKGGEMRGLKKERERKKRKKERKKREKRERERKKKKERKKERDLKLFQPSLDSHRKQEKSSAAEKKKKLNPVSMKKPYKWMVSATSTFFSDSQKKIPEEKIILFRWCLFFLYGKCI